MRRPGRKGRILKWVGLVLSFVLAGFWVLSLPRGWGWVYMRQTLSNNPRFIKVQIAGGAMLLTHSRSVAIGPPRGFSAQQGKYAWSVVYRMQADWTSPSLQKVWLCPEVNPIPFNPGWWAVLPLWVPFLVVAMPSAFLWWLDRRRVPPGHCQRCGYDLTGNVSGVCSECGTPLPESRPGR